MPDVLLHSLLRLPGILKCPEHPCQMIGWKMEQLYDRNDLWHSWQERLSLVWRPLVWTTRRSPGCQGSDLQSRVWIETLKSMCVMVRMWPLIHDPKVFSWLADSKPSSLWPWHISPLTTPPHSVPGKEVTLPHGFLSSPLHFRGWLKCFSAFILKYPTHFFFKPLLIRTIPWPSCHGTGKTIIGEAQSLEKLKAFPFSNGKCWWRETQPTKTA